VIEFATASFLLLAVCILVGRRGHRHLLRRGLPWAMLGAGAVAGVLLEMLPFTSFRAAPSAQTALAAVCGLLAARLAARGVSGWARGQERDVASGHALADARLVHPLLGAGLWLSGTAVLWTLVCARHEVLEVNAQERDPETLVLRGAEEVSLPGDPVLSHAVLLVHGFLGSPADFGDLPQALHAKGLAVRSIRLPQHGTIPSALVGAKPGQFLAAVEEARAALAADHAKVSVVGFSVGGTLALRSAKASAPHRLVLVNPYLGELATPAWSPFATDSLLPVAAKLTRRVLRPPGMTRCNDPAGVARQRAYFTVPLEPVVALAGFARKEPLDAPECQTLLLLSREDRTAPSSRAEAWFAAAKVPPTREKVVFDASDHLLFLDHDREAAAAAIVSWLLASR
jgi:carboxylesterase